MSRRYLASASSWPEVGETGGPRNAAAVVPRKGSWLSDVMSQEAGVSAGPDTDGCVTLGQALPLSLSSLGELLGGSELDFQL